MNKIKIEQMKCFDEVAKVIGAERARRELFKVVEKFELNHGFDEKHLLEGELVGSFNWRISPQGYDFWNDIDDGVNPYE